MEHQERVEKGWGKMLGFYNPNDIEPDLEEVHYYCPICDAEVLDGEHLYKTKAGDIIGCDNCLTLEWVESKEVCPECESEVFGGEILYKDEDGDIIGCECCVDMVYPEDEL